MEKGRHPLERGVALSFEEGVKSQISGRRERRSREGKSGDTSETNGNAPPSCPRAEKRKGAWPENDSSPLAEGSAMSLQDFQLPEIRLSTIQDSPGQQSICTVALLSPTRVTNQS